MYIKIAQNIYQCGKPIFGSSLRWSAVNGLELPINATIYTCRDDGFVMREDDPTDWARQIYENDTLILTNAPETGPEKLTDIQEIKISELSESCQATIYAGMDIELPDGTTEHFNYNDHDQINIKEMFDAARMGATEWPYQADDGSCRAYTAAEIFVIYPALAGMKTATLTYYHALEDLVNAAETAEGVEAITWGQPLEGDSLTHYNEMIAIAQAQMQTILGGAANA